MRSKEQLYTETLELTKSLIQGNGLNKGYGTCDVEEILKTTYEALIKFNEYFDSYAKENKVSDTNMDF